MQFYLCWSSNIDEEYLGGNDVAIYSRFANKARWNK